MAFNINQKYMYKKIMRTLDSLDIDVVHICVRYCFFMDNTSVLNPKLEYIAL